MIEIPSILLIYNEIKQEFEFAGGIIHCSMNYFFIYFIYIYI